jgi:hypothetical protein
MSKIEKSKKVLKKTLFFKVSEHNALIFIFLSQKNVTIKKFENVEKNLKKLILTFFNIKI